MNDAFLSVDMSFPAENVVHDSTVTQRRSAIRPGAGAGYRPRQPKPSCIPVPDAKLSFAFTIL